MNIKDKLKTLPKKPGCYLMKDKDGKIIYVGKAIVLKNRVNSYFVGSHDYKTTKLVSNINDFDYILTKNEKEELILEYNENDINNLSYETCEYIQKALKKVDEKIVKEDLIRNFRILYYKFTSPLILLRFKMGDNK